MMKIFLAILISLFLFSCKERNSLIDLTPTAPGERLQIDSSYVISTLPAVEAKRVVIEEFTGDKCVNCPAAQQTAEEISDSHSGLISIASFHVTPLSDPYPASKYNFQTNDGTNYLQLMGGPPRSLPQGAINQNKYKASGDTTYYTSYSTWAAHVQDELNTSSPVNVDFVTLTWDNSTNVLKGVIKITYLASVSQPTGLTVLLTENDLIDLQLTPHGIDSNYAFQHVLRKVMHPSQGLLLDSAAKPGHVYQVSFSTQLPSQWQAANMTAIAFVHNMAAGDIKVLQSTEKNVQ